MNARRLLIFLLLLPACATTDGDGDGSETDGDGDGDGSETDGDGDTTGDGDGDTGDGDGDGDTGDGDGDGDGDTGDGDGDGDGDTGDGDGDTGDGDGDGDGDPLSNDPFDETSCAGLAWDQSAATEYLGGMSRLVLDDAIMQIRSRVCNGDACDEWGVADDWTLAYLSYSGGVTTHYTPLLMDMRLVLFDDDGTTRLSIQHQSFGAGGYSDQQGAIVDFPPAVVAYPHLRAFNEFPLYPNDYDDLDYLVKDGTTVLGEGCARWVADPYGVGSPYTNQYAILFRW